MIEEVRRVAAIKDDAARVKAAASLMTELQAGVMETARIRREGIRLLRESGQSLADVGRLLGVSRARVAQLKDAGPPPERAFLALDRLRVAIPEQPEGRLVARADAAAGQQLLTLALSMDLRGELEYLPPSGDIDLTGDDLIIICRPETSPQITALLQADPRLDLSPHTGDQGEIVERDGGKTHSVENAENSAIAYLGRLPDSSGDGSVLVIASAQPIGAYGAAHYLNEHLADLYNAAGRHHFSMAISSVHDLGTDEVVSSRALTGPLLHAGTSE
ncbi:hypothetical protein GCM10022221_81830 [Actinocorallia aurea]